MFLINCPYCGERDQAEFSCGGEAHIARPKNPPELSDDQWADYLFMRKNIKGIQFERWNHSNGCRRWFNVVRNTSTDEIIKVYNMGESPPNINGNNPSTPSGEPIIGSGNISTTFEKK
tara:strand:- start:320 stop:673 length:354 start_codon:yes stop_codon:yes gene_type:complete